MVTDKKIGGVTLNYDFYNPSLRYNDGDEVEEFIVDVLKSGRDILSVLKTDNRWAVLYHLSPQRANIVEPMDIDGLDVLEIGSGFGAVTESLSKRAEHVDCIELSERRSLGNAWRNAGRDNVTIYLGNFGDINLNKKYSVVVGVGVLEYAALYVEGAEPFAGFLDRIKHLLKPGGKAYIAIENRLGMKYFLGAPEDHNGLAFSGIEGYENTEHKARTFSRSALKSLVENAGFSNVFFYYPLPDYKLPSVIYSDNYLPGKGDPMPEFPVYDTERVSSFDERKALTALAGTEEFKVFANSFLVEAICK